MPRRFTLKKSVVITTIVAICTALLALYEIALPNIVASNYFSRLTDAANTLNSNFHGLANTTKLGVFNGTNQTTQQDTSDLTATSLAIDSAQTQLAAFIHTSQQLRILPISGFFGNYHAAVVQKRLSVYVNGQSQDVLNQYRQLIVYLQNFYAYQVTFVTITNRINAVSDLATLTPVTSTLYADARTLNTNANSIQHDTNAPPGFTTLSTATAAMYRQCADGLDELANGLLQRNDTTVSYGIALVEAATSQNDNTVADMPTALVNNSAVYNLASELPGKVLNLSVEGGGVSTKGD